MSSTEMPAALTSGATEAEGEAQAARRQWIETALVLFTATAVLVVSFLAVMTALA